MATDPKKYQKSDELDLKYEFLVSEHQRVAHELFETKKILDGILKSNSWKLTAPLRDWRHYSKKIFPLFRFKKTPLVRTDIIDLEEISPNTFKKTGASSYLAWGVKPSSKKQFIDSGWKAIQFQTTHPIYFHLSFDEGKGFTDLNKRFISITPQNRKIAIKFPSGIDGLNIKKIRIDLFETGENQNIGIESVQEIGSLQLLWLLIKSKIGPSPKYWITKIKKAFELYKTGGFHSIKLKLLGDEPTADYQEWIDLYDSISNDDISLMKSRISSFLIKPKFSVIIPTYNTHKDHLSTAIKSVLDQVYENWELCIADDASTKPEVKETLNKFAKSDPRIKVIYRQKNGHISEASNDALKIATGDYIALLDHDDQLRPHALYMMAEEINKNSNASLIYSDEDKINIVGTRFNPYFKSSFNYHLFLQQNYICHLTVIKKEIVDKVGGFRVGYEGSQDWDLFLRVIDSVDHSTIKHIPHILYHWRAIEGSTAQSSDFKPYALIAAQKALEDHFKRINHNAFVETLEAISQFRIHHPIPSPEPLVSIIIPTKDKAEILARCVNSILQKTTYKNFEILIIDNNSEEDATFKLFDRLTKDHRVSVTRDTGPFNFSALNNRAVTKTKGQILGFLNNDLEVITEGWLSEMVSYAVQPKVGAVGAKLLFPNNLIQHGGVVLGIGGVAGHSHKGQPKDSFGYFNRAYLAQSFSAVTAACLLVRRETFDKIGGFDEAELKVAFNDVDLCLKIKGIGLSNVWTPYSLLYHYESVSRGYEHSPEKFERFEKESRTMKTRWGETLNHDPYYNPNLTIQSEDFKLATPPRAARPWNQASKIKKLK